MILDNMKLISRRTDKMKCRINSMWFPAMIVIVVGISNAGFYDFEGGGGFTLNGNAVVDSGSVRLTENAGSLTGSVIFDSISPDPVANFDVSFDFRMTSGADGMSFALMDTSVLASTVTFGESGPGVGSLSVGFDIYDNGGVEPPGGNYVDIRLENVVIATAVPTFTMESSQWHHANISFIGGNLTLVLTPEGGTEETLFDAVAVPGFTPFVGRYGFGARTGGSTSEQRVDNVRIGKRTKAYNPTPADGEWFRYYTDVTELEWTLPPSLFDANDVTCDVLWFGTDPESTPELLVDNAEVELVSLGGRVDGQAHYYWRVDCYDPNGDVMMKTEGDLWTFSSDRDTPMVFVDESGLAGEESTDISEELPIPNRDDYLLSLSSDPGSDTVTITVNEVPTNNRLTTTKETVESWDGDALNAPLLSIDAGYPTESRINSSADDMEESVVDGTLVGNGGQTSSDLEIFNDGPDMIIGLRFNDIAIVQGRTIVSAVVKFVVDETEASGEVHGFVTGEAVDSAAPFDVATAYRLRDRLAANPTTSVPFIWTADYAIGETIVTSDIGPIIQEIVNRPSWGVGNSIALFLTETMYPDVPDIDFINATDPWALRGSSTYVLDTNNWQGVTVTIAAIDDEELEPDPDTVTLEHEVVGTGVWAGVQADPVEVSITENECGAWLFKAYDFNQNCFVDIADLADIVDAWLTCTWPNIPGSGCVDIYKP